MHKLRIAGLVILVVILGMIFLGTPAFGWTLEDCQKVQFDHPDCIKFQTPTPRPTYTPRPSPSKTPSPTVAPTPTEKDDRDATPTPTAKPTASPAPTGTPSAPSQTPPTPAPTTAPTAKPTVAPVTPIKQLPSTSTD